MGQWFAHTVPKCEKRKPSAEMLVTIENGRRKSVARAIYIPYHHCTTEDTGWGMPDDVLDDDWEYIEEDDTWWIPEGWYEVCDYMEDYSYATITDKVVAWSKLPKPYEPRSKRLQRKSELL